MKDSIVMNVITGEVMTATEAIRQYYSVDKHDILDAWTDEWTDTGLEADTELLFPDFTKVLSK